MSSQELLRKFCKTIQNIYKTLVGSCICTKLTKYRSANMIDWRHQFLPNDIDCFFIKEKKMLCLKVICLKILTVVSRGLLIA